MYIKKDFVPNDHTLTKEYKLTKTKSELMNNFTNSDYINALLLNFTWYCYFPASILAKASTVYE